MKRLSYSEARSAGSNVCMAALMCMPASVLFSLVLLGGLLVGATLADRVHLTCVMN